VKSKDPKNSIWGKRRQRMRAPQDVLGEAENETEKLKTRSVKLHQSLSKLRESFVPVSRSYFSLAALTRRANLEESFRSEGLARLFSMRTLIESKLLDEFRTNSTNLDIYKEATKPSFFGKSKKQGVSIRYALSSCVPTVRCGGRCYAHDGRDRELLHICRGVLNYYVGYEYENGNDADKEKILVSLSKAIDQGAEAALGDQVNAAKEGYSRLPRIRFSHVGEMAATPKFTNALAHQINLRDARIQCVIYTRHPDAILLNTKLLVVNFTLEGADDNRTRHIPDGARIVNSAWDGQLNEDAEVNFLEHHVEKASSSEGKGSICPVTASHKQTPSCDLARCEKCFVSTQ
jgi:hypothetical protein